MFCIELICGEGGSRLATGKTLAECRNFAAQVCKAFPSAYVAATTPYAAYKSGTHGITLPWPYPDAINATIPFEIMKCLGMELRLTYLDYIKYIGKR